MSRETPTAYVSENTKNAQAIAKAWRGAVHRLDPDRFQIEVLVAPELDQKIDVLDPETATAYEFKVSGKNAWAEFYKDIVKVIMWNEKRNEKISTLVFITEETFGRPFLNAPNPRPTSTISRSTASLSASNTSVTHKQKTASPEGSRQPLTARAAHAAQN